MSPLVLIRRTTSTLAPDQVANLAAWYRSDSGLYQDAVGTINPTLLDGQVVGRWENRVATPAGHLTQSALGPKPVLATGRLNGLPTVRFDGTEDFLTGAALSNYLDAENYCLYLVGYVTAPASALPAPATVTYNQAALLADASSQFGLFVNSTPQARAFNWQAGDQSVPVAIVMDTFTLFRVRHVTPITATPGTLYLRRSGLPEVSVAAGATSSLAGALLVAKNSLTTYLKCEIAEMFFHKGAPSATDLAGLDRYVEIRYGISF